MIDKNCYKGIRDMKDLAKFAAKVIGVVIAGEVLGVTPAVRKIVDGLKNSVIAPKA